MKMKSRACTLEVKEFPDPLNAIRGQRFLGELQSKLHDDRPYIVLDCSKVNQLDRLFEMFDTNAEAVNSFRGLSAESMSHGPGLTALTGPLGM
jgi:hypothetical protein